MTKIRKKEFLLEIMIKYSSNGIIQIILIKKLNKKAFLEYKKYRT